MPKAAQKRAYRQHMRDLEQKLKARKADKARLTKERIAEDLRKMGIKPGRPKETTRDKLNRYMAELVHSLPNRRAEAAFWVGVHKVQAARFRLFRLLKDPNARVRANAVYSLGLLDTRHISAVIFDLMERDRSIEVKGRCAEALGRYQYKRALPILLTYLRAKDPRLRMGALEGLGYMGELSCLPKVAELLRDTDAEVRLKAAVALGRMGSRKAAVPLNRALDDSSGPVVAEAARALARLGARALVPRMERLLGHPSEPARQAALEALARLRSTGSIAVIEKLVQGSSELTAAYAVRALGLLGGTVAPIRLDGLIRSEDNRVRVMAVEAAGLLGARFAIPYITKLLEHPLVDLRKACAQALGRLEAYDATTELTKLLKDPDTEVRVRAVEALGLIGGRRALAACAILMADGDPLLAVTAALCMARQAKSDWELARHATRQLAAMLHKKADPRVAAAAARVLSVLGVKDNRTGMIRLLQLTLHPDPLCRKEAARALGRVGQSDPRQTARTLERLVRRDPDTAVRLEAAIAAGRMGLRKLLPVLDELFRAQKTDRVLDQRLLAAVGLALMEPGFVPEARKLFLRIVNERPNLPKKTELVELMGSIDKPWAKALLKKALVSPNGMVRAEARRQLGQPPLPAPPPPRPEPAPGQDKADPSAKRRSKKKPAPDPAVMGPFPLPPDPDSRIGQGGCGGCGCGTVPRPSRSDKSPCFLIYLFSILACAAFFTFLFAQGSVKEKACKEESRAVQPPSNR